MPKITVDVPAQAPPEIAWTPGTTPAWNPAPPPGDEGESLAGLDKKAKKLRELIAAKEAEYKQLLDQYNLDRSTPRQTIIGSVPADIYQQITAFDAELVELSRQALGYESKRDAMGAKEKQAGVNVQAGTAGKEAITAENLLSKNINEEIGVRVGKNTAQAQEAVTGVNLLSQAALGRQAAKAGQAGYGMSSGTAGALAAASNAKSAEDLAAIEDYRISRQNLLMGQGTAAKTAAESLTGTINTTTGQWKKKSLSAVQDVTGTHLENVNQITTAPGFSGETPQGVNNSLAAIDSTLNTWSFEAYMDVLNGLTKNSANKSTWDSMLLEKGGEPVNPYGQYSTDISPLTPTAGTSTNLLAAAAAGSETYPDVYSISGKPKSKTGGLI